MSWADDLMDQLNPDNFDEAYGLHTPTIQASLKNGELILTMPYGKILLSAEDTKALTRFLSERVKLPPLPPDDDFEDFRAERVM
jgi:hypothetical protein